MPDTAVPYTEARVGASAVWFTVHLHQPVQDVYVQGRLVQIDLAKAPPVWLRSPVPLMRTAAWSYRNGVLDVELVRL